MKIFVLNTGSSSIKYELFEMRHNKSLAQGLAEGIAIGFSAPAPAPSSIAKASVFAKAMTGQDGVTNHGVRTPPE